MTTENKELWALVINAIHKMPEPGKTILIMRILEAKSFDDISAKVGEPVDTVKTIFYRKTEALRKKLAIPGL